MIDERAGKDRRIRVAKRPRSRRGLGLALAIAFLPAALVPSPAWAHKVSAFAAVQGKKVSGEAYFRDGTPLRGARVTALDPGGKILAETQTDSSGKFSIPLVRRCPLRLVVDAGDGHMAEYTIRADEMPADLPETEPSATVPAVPPPTPQASAGESPAPDRAASAGDSPASKSLASKSLASKSPTSESPTSESPTSESPASKSPASKSPASESLASESPASDSPASESLAGVKAELAAIQTQLVQLRRDLAAREDRARWSDVLGGIGYILGLMGLAFYFFGVSAKTRGAARQPGAAADGPARRCDAPP